MATEAVLGVEISPGDGKYVAAVLAYEVLTEFSEVVNLSRLSEFEWYCPHLDRDRYQKECLFCGAREREYEVANVAGEFEKELRSALRSFEYDSALLLSQEIHKAEERGAVLTRIEERLWMDLTQRIAKREEKYEEFLDPS